MYNAEGIGIMESATLRRYRIPYQIMGLHCLVAALVEVCPGGVTRGGGELREEHPNEAIGDGIDGFPAIFCPSKLPTGENPTLTPQRKRTRPRYV